MKKLIIFTFGIIWGSHIAFSQVIGEINTDPIDYRLKVKQLDEFMRRFNLQDVPSLFQNEDTLLQETYGMTAVFDFQLVKNRKDEVKEFVTTMLENKVKLNYTDSNWIAVAHCNAIYKGKETPLTLELATEKVKDFIYKWVIIGASGEILELKPLKQNPGLAISPVDNEVNFISLKHITSKEGQNILNYKGKSAQLDAMSVFFALVNSGQLQIKNVQQLEYKFTIAPRYEFTVRNFVRDAMNSGWLIADFHKLQ